MQIQTEWRVTSPTDGSPNIVHRHLHVYKVYKVFGKRNMVQQGVHLRTYDAYDACPSRLTLRAYCLLMFVEFSAGRLILFPYCTPPLDRIAYCYVSQCALLYPCKNDLRFLAIAISDVGLQ